MPSRGQTAPRSQDTRRASRSKDVKTATRSGSKQPGTRQETRHAGTRLGTEQTNPRTAASRRDESRGGGTAAKSLFNKERNQASGGAGEKLKSDDVWNKFLDDKDVVRAPTAESRNSRDTGDDQLTDVTEESDFSDSEGKPLSPPFSPSPVLQCIISCHSPCTQRSFQ